MPPLFRTLIDWLSYLLRVHCKTGIQIYDKENLKLFLRILNV